jgi:hypothetical protein
MRIVKETQVKGEVAGKPPAGSIEQPEKKRDGE